jgi:exonuclease III
MQPVRIFAWNVRGGNRGQSISDVVRCANADAVVLSDCRPSNFVSLAAGLRDAGFTWVTGTNQGDYTGLLMASKAPIRPGSMSSRILPGHLCHVQVPDARLSIVGVYGPLRRNGIANPVPAFWEELLQSARHLSTEMAVIVGDLNTAIAPCDTSSGRALPASKSLQRLASEGWRDVFREVHGDRQDYSYWEGRGAYRIDLAMLSPAAPVVRSADYVRELGGYHLGKWSSDPQAVVASDHAALLLDI